MRRSRLQYPKPAEVARVMRALDACIPMDTKPKQGWRESLKLVPNYRIKSTTGEIDWCVDIYSGRYYIVSVGDRLTEECKSIPQLVGYMCRMLGVRPRGR
jgi:hypothetical protein